MKKIPILPEGVKELIDEWEEDCRTGRKVIDDMQINYGEIKKAINKFLRAINPKHPTSNKTFEEICVELSKLERSLHAMAYDALMLERSNK